MDGDVDLAIANSSSDNMTIRLGAGDGTFPTEPTAFAAAAATGRSWSRVGNFDFPMATTTSAVADLNSTTFTISGIAPQRFLLH